MKLIKVFPIIALLLVVFITGCKKEEVTDVNSTVISTDPANNATGVVINKIVTAKFSAAMDPATLTATTFTLKVGTTLVPGAVSHSDSTASFTPSGNLLPDTTYTATIKTGAKNLSGLPLKNDYVWTFTTGTLPAVTSTDPANNATGVILTKVVTATFNAPMDPATISAATFTLKQGTTPVAGAVTYSGTTASFTPANNLLPSVLYTATITSGVKNVAGNSMASDHEWTFTTGAVPTVTSTDPANNATGVALNKTVTATFSAPMDPLTLIGTTFTVKQGSTSVNGTVSYTGSTASFTPSNALTPNTIYTGTITTGAKNVPGIPLANNYVWTFTTGVVPTVTFTDPANLATGVALNKMVSATFSTPMDQTTFTVNSFTVKQGTTPVAGIVSCTGTTTFFTPANNYLPGMTYTATITTGAKNISGISLANNYVWSFTTGSTLSGLAPVDIGAAGNYVILAKTAIINNPISAITGDLGLSPAATSYITGFDLTNATGYATASQVTGKIYAADMAPPAGINLTTAVSNMITAYTDAAGRPTPDFSELGTGNIGGKTLTPGLYKWTNTVTLPSNVIISGGATDVWIFQISGDLTVSNAVNVTLTGGALPKNIFWQVAGTVTLGTTSHFEGIILSQTGITFQTGASFNGRALAQTTVILDGNAITKP